MRCKFCKAEMDDDRKYCPNCGKRQDAPVKNPVKKAKQAASKKKTSKTPTWQIVLAILLSVVIVGLLIYLFVSGGDDTDKNDPGVTPTAPQKEEIDYAAHADVVVGKLLDQELTNGLLQLFFSSYLTDFCTDYSGSLSYIGLDVSIPLDEQVFPYDGAETWQDYFLDMALERWQNCVIMGKMAEEDGYVPEETWTKLIEDQMASLEDIAKEGNYTSVEEMLKTYYGDVCTVEIYRQYLTINNTADAYYYHMLEVNDEQIEAAYEKNKDKFTEDGITLNSHLVSSVRHILIEPEGGTKSEDGKKMVYTDEEWAACLTRAEAVLAEWRNGEATEESFKALVTKYTADKESIPDGGLYEKIANDGKYMKPFQDWAIDTARQTGDTALVKTDYGYHIMYYVSGEPEWKHYSRIKAQEEILTAQQERMEGILKETPPETFRDKVVMQNVYQLYR